LNPLSELGRDDKLKFVGQLPNLKSDTLQAVLLKTRVVSD
jgi:hypothetical protein